MSSISLISFLSLISLHLRRHLLESSDELLQIFGIEHDRRLLSAAGLLGYFEEHAVAGLLQVDIERPLLGMNRDGMNVIRESALSAALECRSWCRGRLRSRLIILRHAAAQF